MNHTSWKRSEPGLVRLSMGLLCGALVVAGCKPQDKDQARGATASAEPASAASSAAPPAPADRPAAGAPPPGPAAIATPSPSGPPSSSPVPTVAEWNAVKGEITVRGSSALGCETKGLREWVRISCRGDDPGRGAPIAVQVGRGNKSAEVFTFASGGIASLVYRFEPGTDLEATFMWTNETQTLRSAWPRGAPKPAAFGEFSSPS